MHEQFGANRLSNEPTLPTAKFTTLPVNPTLQLSWRLQIDYLWRVVSVLGIHSTVKRWEEGIEPCYILMEFWGECDCAVIRGFHESAQYSIDKQSS